MGQARRLSHRSKCNFFDLFCYRWDFSDFDEAIGIKVHRMITKEGIPIECLFTPGAEADIADKTYNDYVFEDQLKEFEFI